MVETLRIQHNASSWNRLTSGKVPLLLLNLPAAPNEKKKIITFLNNKSHARTLLRFFAVVDIISSNDTSITEAHTKTITSKEKIAY